MNEATAKRSGKRKRLLPLPIQMLLGLVLGALAGFLAPAFSSNLQPVGTAFIQAVKMIVVPLVFTAITLGIYQMGSSVGRLGKVSLISMLYFLVSTVISVAIGLLLNNIFHPGAGADLSQHSAIPKHIAVSVDWTKFFLDMIPSNIVVAMSGGNLLPVLVFAAMLGLALATLGVRAKPMVDMLDALMAAVFKMTDWIISLSPIAIFAIIAWLFATKGLGTLVALIKLVGVMYLGLAILMLVFALILRLAGERPITTFREVMEPFLLAFATRSSEATLPLHMEKLIANGVPRSLASLVLPLGYAFNRDGSIMYFGLAVGFLADAYHIPLTWPTLLSIILVTTLASKGSANVPSGGLVAVAMVLSTIGVPVEALAVIAGVDAFLDMGRTAVNVISNTVAVKLVMRLTSADELVQAEAQSGLGVTSEIKSL
ncbi:dicarboxylate/amino acid:cation symporter [Acerihabitans sp. TG2]|uniref:dicarboxylate/amino acid:cation symporter n=1 Tax=Acerihabitans sp. TG2 TaxID=3096008 RepID=UPI002B23CF92|nr:dicarboxylate/amino acid:cation symporter [Acerihabitans sp. TG2]MEA9390117.1 dicarboxylate/amino acid:cation symporter [Acerihabitans sp. TG2]